MYAYSEYRFRFDSNVIHSIYCIHNLQKHGEGKVAYMIFLEIHSFGRSTVQACTRKLRYNNTCSPYWLPKLVGLLTRLQRHLGPFFPTYRRNERLSSTSADPEASKECRSQKNQTESPFKGSFRYPLNPLLEPKSHPLFSFVNTRTKVRLMIIAISTG
jgi:hypothetical protein